MPPRAPVVIPGWTLYPGLPLPLPVCRPVLWIGRCCHIAPDPVVTVPLDRCDYWCRFDSLPIGLFTPNVLCPTLHIVVPLPRYITRTALVGLTLRWRHHYLGLPLPIRLIWFLHTVGGYVVYPYCYLRFARLTFVVVGCCAGTLPRLPVWLRRPHSTFIRLPHPTFTALYCPYRLAAHTFRSLRTNSLILDCTDCWLFTPIPDYPPSPYSHLPHEFPFSPTLTPTHGLGGYVVPLHLTHLRVVYPLWLWSVVFLLLHTHPVVAGIDVYPIHLYYGTFIVGVRLLRFCCTGVGVALLTFITYLRYRMPCIARC